ASQKDGVLSRLKERFRYIFVDEYQDINKGQYQLVRLLAGDGKNLCVIGDPDQSIYGFRGADNHYFKRFEQDYPDTEKIVFKRNYRSTETILEASFQLITGKYGTFSSNQLPETGRDREISSTRFPATGRDVTVSVHQLPATGKEESILLTRAPETGREEKNPAKTKIYSGIQGEQHIHILEAASEESQAVMIGKTIERLVGGISMFSMDAGKADSALNDEYSFSDVAVLYRTKKQSEVLSRVFEKAGIPFQTADRKNIFLQKGIKELISSLRIIIDRGTFYDQEVLSRYSKKFMMLPLTEIKQKSTAEILKQLIDHLAIDKIISKSNKSIETRELLVKEAEKYPDPAVFYEHIAMKKDIDTVEHQAEKVSLMTMHAAKGLEFKVVFIAGCMDGLIPFFNKCENIDEERRLFYVAMTRAEERLYLCHAKKRIVYGKTVAAKRSPFLDAIEENLKHYSRSEFKKAEKKDCGQQLDLFGKI
ncbi:MAG: ATP-dependent helicase, partial [Desulfamplus sp.]|nr:ATP-dependent helicase [Desulfamplus sp.]